MIEPVTPTADKKIARYVCYFSYVVVIFVHSCNLRQSHLVQSDFTVQEIS